jgi:hypothetical protein
MIFKRAVAKLRAQDWTAITIELVIVTLGVLLALAAQELVQSLHWKSEVKETRQALDAELSRDLAAFDYRMNANECLIARSAEIQKWAESLGTDKPLKLKHALTPIGGFAIRTEVWDLVEGDVVSRIPLKDRLNYAGLYSGMRSFDRMADSEGDAWDTIFEFDGAARFDGADIRKIVQAAKSLAGNSGILPAWNTTMSRQARELGLKPDPNLLKTANPLMHQMRKEACEPYL